MDTRTLLKRLLDAGSIKDPPEELLAQLIELGIVSNPTEDLTDLAEIQEALTIPMSDRRFALWVRPVVNQLLAEVAVLRPFVRTALGFTDGVVTESTFQADSYRCRSQLSQLRR